METTREGRRFILAACLIGLAAINTGNNLIYLILSLMVSLVLLSLVVLRKNLSGLSARMAIAHPVFAGERASAVITLDNPRSRVPAYSLHIAVKGLVQSAAQSRCVMIQPGGNAEVLQPIAFPRRGWYGTVALELRSSFPFILFSLRREIACRAGILVYPALLDVEELSLPLTGAGSSPVPRWVGPEEELSGLREYRPGDDMRRVHWKASAKADGLMVRENAQHEMMRVTIAVDNLWGPGEGGAPGGHGLVESLEKAVSLAASFVRHYLDAGYMVRLISCRKTIPFGQGHEHLLSVLDFLAVIGMETSWDGPTALGADGAFLIVLRRKDSALAGMAGSGMVVDASDL